MTHRPFDSSSQILSVKAISRCEKQGERDVQLQRGSPPCMQSDYFLRTWGENQRQSFPSSPLIRLYFSWSFSQEGMKTFPNLNPSSQSEDFISWKVIVYICLLWCFFLQTVPVFEPEEIRAENSSAVERSLGCLWMLSSCMKVTPNDLWMVHMQWHVFAQNALKIILNDDCRC